ncbi:dolichyl-phosphate beta-glucosyltransferase [Allomyces arbusculus]|nr:dolichyl-phosphate beta-glucosyltransferase [Allomyces arbusculus]
MDRPYGGRGRGRGSGGGGGRGGGPFRNNGNSNRGSWASNGSYNAGSAPSVGPGPAWRPSAATSAPVPPPAEAFPALGSGTPRATSGAPVARGAWGPPTAAGGPRVPYSAIVAAGTPAAAAPSTATASSTTAAAQRSATATPSPPPTGGSPTATTAPAFNVREATMVMNKRWEMMHRAGAPAPTVYQAPVGHDDFSAMDLGAAGPAALVSSLPVPALVIALVAVIMTAVMARRREHTAVSTSKRTTTHALVYGTPAYDAAIEYLELAATNDHHDEERSRPRRAIPGLDPFLRVVRRTRVPNLDDDTDPVPLAALSVVIPAYNEQTRLPAMLDEAFTYLLAERRAPSSFEILVVDDGSKDQTVAVALATAHRWRTQHGARDWRFAVVRLPRNAGKGGAVRVGLRTARAELVLFADADGATRFADVEKLVAAVSGRIDGDVAWPSTVDKAQAWPPAVVIGSRAHLVRTDAVVKRSWLRNLLMYAFHWVLWLLAGPLRDVGDTQCGFKLLTRDAARVVAPALHVRGWIFDIELLLLARALTFPVVEVAVSWHEVGGSKVSLMTDSVLMLLDLLVIRVSYLVGRWKVPRARPPPRPAGGQGRQR